jgi:hypothetical protein
MFHALAPLTKKNCVKPPNGALPSGLVRNASIRIEGVSKWMSAR